MRLGGTRAHHARYRLRQRHALPACANAGIVVVRTTPRATASEIEAALRALLRAVGDSSLTGRLLIVHPTGRVREYRSADE
jgi:hypothetical protein